MRRLLFILLAALSLQVSAQTTTTLPSGYTPWATQIYKNSLDSIISGATGKKFIKLAPYSDILKLQDSVADKYSKSDADARFLSPTAISATSPIFYNSATGVISSQAASTSLSGYITASGQTIGGIKTFSDTRTAFNGTLNLLPANGNFSSTYGGMYLNNLNTSFVFKLAGISQLASLNMSNLTLSRTYTFPNANGTIALTSDIPDAIENSMGTMDGGTVQSGNFNIDGYAAFGDVNGSQYSFMEKGGIQIKLGVNSTNINSGNLSLDHSSGTISLSPEHLHFDQNGVNSLKIKPPVIVNGGIQTFQDTSGIIALLSDIPDQTVSLTSGTGISTSGTYPNFTIINTSPSPSTLSDSLLNKANKDFSNVASGVITNAKLANSTISGVSLGGSLANHSAGYGINGSTYNGSSTATWSVDTTTAGTGLVSKSRLASYTYTKAQADALLANKVTANSAITGATKAKITYDSKGLVTAGEDLTESDIPSLSISKVTGLQTALDGKIDESREGVADGIATLNASGKLNNSQVPAIAISETFVVASQAAMLALSAAEQGDVAVRTDLNKSLILTNNSPGTLASWQELLTPTDAVSSVNGQTGTVTLGASDVGAPTTTGAGASGTWGIDISGNAATATLWGSQTASFGTFATGDLVYLTGASGLAGEEGIRPFSASKVQTFLGLGSNAYTSTAYLPLSGGTLSGAVTINSPFRVLSGNGNILIDNVGSGENYYGANSFHQFQIGGVNKYTIDASGNNTWTGSGTFGGKVIFGSGAFTFNTASAYTDATKGLIVTGKAGSSFDMFFTNSVGNEFLANPTGTQNLTLFGALTGTSATFTAPSSTTPSIFINKPGETAYGAIGVVNDDASNGGLRFYSKAAGAFTPVLDLAYNGAATFSGSLTGTSATFSSTLSATDISGTTGTFSSDIEALNGTFLESVTVPNDPYSATWDGDLEVPTKNAVFKQIESIGSGYVPYTGADGAVNLGSYDLTLQGLTIGKGGGSQYGNAAFGFEALNLNTTGQYNISIGDYSMSANTIGYNNIAVGETALSSNTTGHSNVAIGVTSLGNNSTGAQNIGIGGQANNANSTGGNNVAVGYKTLYNNTVSNNTGIGWQAGYDISTGGSNTIIGYNTGKGVTTGANNTVIGANVTGLATGLSSNIILANGTGSIKAQHDGTNWTFAGQLNKTALDTAPASATDTGTLGEIRVTSTYIYVCTATNTWVRASLATW